MSLHKKCVSPERRELFCEMSLIACCSALSSRNMCASCEKRGGYLDAGALI